jgi:hypothetical protein
MIFSRVRRFALFTLGLELCAIVHAQPSATARLEIEDAAQPQLAVNSQGRVWLAYGRAKDVFVARSDDGGKTFAPAVKVTSQPKLMLGMRRGPRIAAQGDALTVTIIAPELLSFHSSDGGKTWSEATTINEVPTCAREGLHDLAAGPAGQLFVTWLDLRNGKMELWGAESMDRGRTWGKNAAIYRSPDKSICECCHPTALFDAQGNLAVMWRNSIGGARDMWSATRTKGSKEFSAARKLGEGTWTLNACPMDGGRLIALGGGKFGSIWQRAGEVFFAPASGPEISIGKGKQPVALVQGTQTMVVWQQGTDLVSAPMGGAEVKPRKRAENGRFPVVIAVGSGGNALLAYERGIAKGPTSVIVEQF